MYKYNLLVTILVINLSLIAFSHEVEAVKQKKGIATDLTDSDYLFQVEDLNKPKFVHVGPGAGSLVQVQTPKDKSIQLPKNSKEELEDRAKLFMVACGADRFDICHDKKIELIMQQLLNDRAKVCADFSSMYWQPETLKSVEYTYYSNGRFERVETNKPNPRYAEFVDIIVKAKNQEKSLRDYSLQLATATLAQGISINSVIKSFPFSECVNEKIKPYEVVEHNCVTSAIKSGSEELLINLINLGADIKARTKFGTALHYAIETGQLNMVKILIDNKADIESRVQYKKIGQLTCLQLAQLHAQENSEYNAIVQLLIDNDANQNPKIIGNDKSDMEKALEQFCPKEVDKSLSALCLIM